jgi:hypothetical protein
MELELIEIIDDILEQEDHILPKSTKVNNEFSFDELVFNKMANFIINLDPDSLNDNQLQEIIDMIEKLEVEFDDDEGIEEVKTPKFAKRTAANKNQYSKKWYRTNKNSIKRRKAKMSRSSQGRKRVKMKERLAKIGKTATGRRKVRYHRRKRSQEEK